MRKRSALALGLALVAMALASPAEAATWFVDNDGADCPNADYTSIQAAVASPTTLPGDTIQVCAGTYNESVTVNKNDLSIKAKGPAGAVLLDGNGPPLYGFGLVGVTGVLIEGFSVTQYHNNIHLFGSDGNIIRSNITFDASDHDGIVADQGSDANLIEHNVSFGNVRPIGCGISAGGGSSNNIIRNNEVFGNANAGILLGGGVIGSAGPGNVVAHNYSHDNGKPVAGTTRGIGILNAITPGSIIAHNRVQSNNAHGIQVSGAASTNVTVEYNLVGGNGSLNSDDGIRLQEASASIVRYNDSRRNRHNGIHLTGSSNNLVEYNVLDDNGTPGAVNGCGVDISAFTPPGGSPIPSTGNTVRRNVARGHDRAGFRILNTSGNTLEENNAKSNPGDGIKLTNGDSNTVDDNRSDHNGNDGIDADAASVGNTISSNKAIGNAIHDCHDDSGAPPPAPGPANTWTDNRGQTQNRPGLCEGAAVTPPATHP
jgi:parallel beta-helix repeat protein